VTPQTPFILGSVRKSFTALAVMLQPDLACWLVAIAVVLFVKGVIELTLMARLFR